MEGQGWRQTDGAVYSVVEGTGIGEAFGRSRALTKGHRWAIFGLIFIYGIIITLAGFVVLKLSGIAIGQTIIKPEGQSFPPGPWDDRPLQTIAIGVQGGRVLKLYRDIFG